jgi:hypothetical protein
MLGVGHKALSFTAPYDFSEHSASSSGVLNYKVEREKHGRNELGQFESVHAVQQMQLTTFGRPFSRL